MKAPGKLGDPLPAGEVVIRLGVPSMDFHIHGKASPAWFELSTEDKSSDPPRLSVFSERLTTPAQAWAIQGSREAYTAVARLNVDAIRSVRPEPNSPEAPGLDVVWDPIEDERPGADGHAGITGLVRGAAVNRMHTKSLRFQLAELAVASSWLDE